MSLPGGTRLGPYEIVAAIGAGGMGEVYKARDTRLDRAVAIKVLPETLAADGQFRERFDREARAISQLTHPHICTLYDVGDSGGTAFLVMEYLEGETLEQRLRKRALPLDEALQVAIQIADALSVAHRRGIVHRDLKPGNVMLTKSGAKLLDFGLAKTSGPDATTAGLSMLPTTPANLTAQGAILGTFQYMAPEQLEGQEADTRSDIFAFGAVLYELVSGRKAFEGRSRASLIAAILEHDPPPLASLQPLTPSSLDHIVAKCLAKNPDDRWQSARDVTTELKWLASKPETRTEPTAQIIGRSTRAIRAPIIAAIAAAIALGVVASVVVMKRLSQAPSSIVRSIVTTVPAERLLAFPTDETTNEGRPSRTSIAWSPDGQSIVFSASLGGRQQLYVRAMNQLEATPIAGTDGASNPFFSPDGQWIGFAADRALRKVAVSGGPATTICVLADTTGMYGASWGDDGSIVYSLERDGLWRVGAAGGTPERLTKPDTKKGELKHLLPQVLPGGRAVLYTVTHTPLPKWDDTEVVVQDLANGSRREVLKAAADGRYAPSGHLVYLRRGTMMAAPFDLKSLKVTGEALSLVAGVMQSANTTNETFDSGAGQFAISSSGSLLYVPGGIFPDAERTLVWVSRTGVEEPLPVPVRAYLSPRLSPEGTRLTLWTQGDRNVWIYDLARRSFTRVNVDGRNTRTIWAPDGKRIAFSSTVGSPEENAYLISADGSGTAERLTTCDCPSHAAAWTPDGRTIVGVDSTDNTNYDVVLVDVVGTHRKSPLLHGTADEQYPDLSPDGRWIAYASNESGKNEVYVQPFPGLGSRHQISTDGGTAPAWSRDGRELFYTTTETFGGQASLTRMMAVAVTTAPGFVASPPHMLFEGRYGATAILRPYDVSADGQRFLMVKQKERAPVSSSQMVLVQNWLDELKARVPK